MKKEDFYSSIIFSIKNEHSISQSKSSQPPVTVGEANIPINLLVSQTTRSNFEGNLEIRLQNNLLIGSVSVIIIISNKAFDEHDCLFRRIEGGQQFDLMDVIF